MGESTAIGWTDHTFNPWWGCERVSPGCQHCYAETFAKRTGNLVWGKKADRRRFGEKHWLEPFKWRDKAKAEGRPHRVFCASMADVFEYRADHHEDRQRLWTLIELTSPHLIWQLLTKRPENVRDMVPAAWLLGDPGWPDNVWIGTTVEDQERADLRVPLLLNIPARVRFLSCEPLLGPVTFRWAKWHPWRESNHLDGLRQLSWVIVGGESGPGHRALDIDHARTIRDECQEAGVPFFFKQVGGQFPKSGGDLLDGVAYKQFPVDNVAVALRQSDSTDVAS